LDPFMGSGTTLFAAEKLKRNSIGIDILDEYCQMVKDEIKEKELYLFEKDEEYAVSNK
jgi:site-specific DNA-methyltransferase (adenine-specific)